MEYKELIQRVQDAAELATPQQARTVTEVVLGTLGELLPPTERRHLATQLSKPLKDSVNRWVERPPRELTRPHRFSLEEFYHRVAARSDRGYPRAVRCSQAVLGILQEAISPGELDDIFRKLPPEYDELRTGVTRNPASPSLVKNP